MNWERRCSMLQGEDPRRTEAQISIQLGNGLTIFGLMDFEAAKSIFRSVNDPDKLLEGDVVGQEAIVMLPPGTVQAVNFPYVPLPPR